MDGINNLFQRQKWAYIVQQSIKVFGYSITVFMPIVK